MIIKKLKTTLLFSLVLSLFISFPLSPIANAKENESIKTLKESQVSQELQDLDVFFNEVVYLDENGLEKVNYEKMEKIFGKEQTENVQAIEQSAVQAKECSQGNKMSLARSSSKGTFSSCMKEALMDYLGVSAVQAMLTGGVWTYFQKKAWKEAAKLAIKLGVGTNAVALAATFMFYGGKCAYKHGI